MEYEELNQSSDNEDVREIVTIKLIRSQFSFQVQRTKWQIGYTPVLVQRNAPSLFQLTDNTAVKISV